MKRYCKDIDITDRQLIAEATYNCLDDKYGRKDTLSLLEEVSGLESRYIHRIHYLYGKAALIAFVEIVVDTVRAELIERCLHLKPLWYKDKIDPSSGKNRRICIQDVKQQIYDYIAVYALRPLLKRVGEYQCAAIKGRGQSYGIRSIKRWLRNKTIRYAAKNGHPKML